MASAATPKAIAAAVRARREELGLTQQEVAASAEVSVSAIQSTEAGRFTGRPYTLRKIATALGLDPRDPTSANREPYDGRDRRRGERRQRDATPEGVDTAALLALSPEELAALLLRLPADKAEQVMAAYFAGRAAQAG